MNFIRNQINKEKAGTISNKNTFKKIQTQNKNKKSMICLMNHLMKKQITNKISINFKSKNIFLLINIEE